MMDVLDELTSFLESKTNNAWINVACLSIYVRKAHRMVNDEIVQTFDLATLSAITPGTGGLTVALPMIEEKVKAHGFEWIYVENVLTKRLSNFFSRNGYSVLSEDITGIPCLVKNLSCL